MKRGYCHSSDTEDILFLFWVIFAISNGRILIVGPYKSHKHTHTQTHIHTCSSNGREENKLSTLEKWFFVKVFWPKMKTLIKARRLKDPEAQPSRNVSLTQDRTVCQQHELPNKTSAKQRKRNLIKGKSSWRRKIWNIFKDSTHPSIMKWKYIYLWCWSQNIERKILMLSEVLCLKALNWTSVNSKQNAHPCIFASFAASDDQTLLFSLFLSFGKPSTPNVSLKPNPFSIVVILV